MSNFRWKENKMLNAWGFSFEHVTHWYAATWDCPEDYDSIDIPFGDVLDPSEVLFADEFNMCDSTVKAYEDLGDRVVAFTKIIMKYFKRIFPDDDELLDRIEEIYLDEDEHLEYEDWFRLLPKDFWKNEDLVEELGQLVYDTAKEAIYNDDKFLESLDEDYKRYDEDRKAEAQAEAREERAEQEWKDALDRLGL